jgi:hypothetical protein
VNFLSGVLRLSGQVAALNFVNSTLRTGSLACLNCPALATVALTGCTISGFAIPLANMPALRSVAVVGNRFSSPTSVLSVANCPALVSTTVARNAGTGLNVGSLAGLNEGHVLQRELLVGVLLEAPKVLLRILALCRLEHASPLGLGGLMVVSNDDINKFILAMRLPTFLGRFVHFSDVSLACARRVLAESQAQRGLAFSETPNSHAVAKKWEKLRGGAVTLQSDFSTQHYLAAESIAVAFRVFRFRRALALQA